MLHSLFLFVFFVLDGWEQAPSVSAVPLESPWGPQRVLCSASQCLGCGGGQGFTFNLDGYPCAALLRDDPPCLHTDKT